MYFILVGILLFLLFLYGTRNHKSWEIKGVKHDQPLPFVGTSLRQFMQRISISDMMTEFYKKYPDERFVGFYMANTPGIVIKDPELIKHILVTDFHYFHRRGVNFHNTVYEPMLKNLFTVDGDIWKLLRQRLTPAFTSGKLKAMFPLIVERAEKLKKLAAVSSEAGKEVDMRDLMARYTTDFIGAVGFGIEGDALDQEDSMFRKLGRRIFTTTKMDGLRILAKALGVETFKNLHLLTPEIERNTVTLVTNVLKQRNYQNSGRNDFIDLLIDLKQKGVIVGESVEKREADGTPLTVELELDDLLMAAQVFVFFAAGFETSSSTTSYTMHQLAFHPEEQRKCQDEIDEVLKKHGGLSYEAVKDMKYLEMAFKESMRMYPPLGLLMRKCAKSYKLPGTNVVIDEDTMVAIPIHALQTDARYFEEPEKFKPERFLREKEMKKHIYLPFGEGPRACIGERLGQMQSLAGLAALLSEFSVIPCKNTIRHPVTDPSSTITQTIQGGLPLALVARRKVQ